MKKVLAIDPGNEKSAFCVWDGEKLYDFGIEENKVLLSLIYNKDIFGVDRAYIEMVASYGMPVGKSVFDTVFWIGRFYEALNEYLQPELVYRKDVKMHHCGSMRAKDGNIRQALIDKYGEPGTKKNPGRTYGLSKDCWSAFAISTYITETQHLETSAKTSAPLPKTD